MGADAETLNQWTPAPALTDEWRLLGTGIHEWTSPCGRVSAQVWANTHDRDWRWVVDGPGPGRQSHGEPAASRGAAQLLALGEAGKRLAKLDRVARPSFTKADNDKPRTDLLPPHALLEVSRVLGHGAAKYGHDNHFRAGECVESRYIGAALRHLFAHMGGEVNDSESGMAHLAHAAASLLLVMERGAVQRGGK